MTGRPAWYDAEYDLQNTIRIFYGQEFLRKFPKAYVWLAYTKYNGQKEMPDNVCEPVFAALTNP